MANNKNNILTHHLLKTALIIIEEEARKGEFEVSDLESKIMNRVNTDSIDAQHWKEICKRLESIGYKLQEYFEWSGSTTTVSWREK